MLCHTPFCTSFIGFLLVAFHFPSQLICNEKMCNNHNNTDAILIGFLLINNIVVAVQTTLFTHLIRLLYKQYKISS